MGMTHAKRGESGRGSEARRQRDRLAAGWGEPHRMTERPLLELRVGRQAILNLAVLAREPDEFRVWTGVDLTAPLTSRIPPLLAWFTAPGAEIGSASEAEGSRQRLLRHVLLDSAPAIDAGVGIGVWPTVIDRGRAEHVQPLAIDLSVEPGSLIPYETQPQVVAWTCRDRGAVGEWGEFGVYVLPLAESTTSHEIPHAQFPADVIPRSPTHVLCPAFFERDDLIAELTRLVEAMPAALNRFVEAARGLPLAASQAKTLKGILHGTGLDEADLYQIAVNTLTEEAVRYVQPSRPHAALSSWARRRVPQVQHRTVTAGGGEPERIAHARARYRAGDDIGDLSASAQERVRQGRPQVVSMDYDADDESASTTSRLDAICSSASAEDAYLADDVTDCMRSFARLLALIGIKHAGETEIGAVPDPVRDQMFGPWDGDVAAAMAALAPDGHLLDPDALARVWLAEATLRSREIALRCLEEIEGAAVAERFAC